MMYKVTNRFCIKSVLWTVFVCGLQNTHAQDTVLNKYGLQVISTLPAFTASIQLNPENAMVDVKKYIPDISLELRYAGANNFLGKKIYPLLTTTYLRKKAVLALAEIQKELNNQQLGVKIFDAYRPYAATEMMWKLVQDDRYTADPKKGSGHNRGAAVDLTIIDLTTSKELDMGTGFDNFSDTAHHAFADLPKEALQNRLLLKTVMEKHGFKALDTEWWHYSLPDAKTYDLLNLSFKQLKKINSRKATAMQE
jgi:zinc D-Ala-D-Ala dipeptidase